MAKKNSRKIPVLISGFTSPALIFDSFKDFSSKCTSNGANLDPKKHFEHACKPTVCVDFFSETGKCKKKDCPVRIYSERMKRS